MDISECRVKIWENEPVRAIASITFDSQFVVKGIRVLNVQNRFIVCMPSRRGQDGTHRDVAHPINAEMRERINRHVLDAYQEELLRFHAGLPAGAHDDAELDPSEDVTDVAGSWGR
jgi:stage V sporulation protein G